MSILELKQQISRLSQRDRQELQVYLVRLRHETPAWKRATAKRIREMQQGKAVSLKDVEALLAKG